MTLTCNKKVYSQFEKECNKCPMKTECIDGGKSVAVAVIEMPTINLSMNFTQDSTESSAKEIASRIAEMLKSEISANIRM